jgi:hypothetical protein
VVLAFVVDGATEAGAVDEPMVGAAVAVFPAEGLVAGDFSDDAVG